MEYQHYEFHSLDKPLSAAARKKISSWSSRVEATATSATFTYSYSDFPEDEFQVVEKYFDMMLYLANWGSKRLLLKIPAHLVDFNEIKLFDCSVWDKHYAESDLIIQKKGNHVFIDLSENEDEGYIEWIETGGLIPLLSIREDIINGDYRTLYLFWLHVMSSRVKNLEESKEIGVILKTIEPPVPPNLAKHNGAIQAFIKFWEIDNSWIKAASERSPSHKEKVLNFENMIQSLSESEKVNYLHRLAKGEVRLHQTFLKFLKSKEGISNTKSDSKTRRNVEELLELTTKVDGEKKALAKIKAEKKKKEKMNKMAKEESQHWESVKYNVSQGNSRSYDLAIQTLEDLLELAEYENKMSNFKFKLSEVKAEFSRKSSFIQKVKRTFIDL
jgi:hypothetical protein